MIFAFRHVRMSKHENIVLEGSFSAVSKPTFASKYSFFSIFRELPGFLLYSPACTTCTVSKGQLAARRAAVVAPPRLRASNSGQTYPARRLHGRRAATRKQPEEVLTAEQINAHLAVRPTN